MDKVIHTTTDYSIFKKLPGNRDTKCVAKIVKSIKEVGYILCPLLCNEKMEVIDGQNRLEALIELELPVDYMVQEGIGLKECRLMNTGRGNWTTEDYIKSYAEDGNENYQRLMILLAEFKQSFSTEGVIFFTNPKYIPNQGGANLKSVKDGALEINEEQFKSAKSKLSSAKALGYVDFKDDNEMLARQFWGAVAYAYYHQGVSVKELIEKMNKDPKQIVPCGKVPAQLAYFDEVLNKNKSAKNKVFMSTDFQQRKYIGDNND